MGVHKTGDCVIQVKVQLQSPTYALELPLQSISRLRWVLEPLHSSWYGDKRYVSSVLLTCTSAATMSQS